MALVLSVALAASGCAANRNSSHPISPAGAVVLTGLAAATLGLVIWAGSACEHCDAYSSAEPRPYPYPPAGEW